ncbi:MAG: hypothetical protein HFP76_06485 [Methylococcales symbiont of Iophon sp. n. MRB-2018]|nr:MAG: hypothetical protein HFP76_06485 [Methylococcales symbiont of Iophon sp. n. MRB-2018]
MSGTISADRQGWWKCSKIVWNNLYPRTRTNQKSRGLSSFVFRLSSFVFRLSSFVFRLSSFVFRLSS